MSANYMPGPVESAEMEARTKRIAKALMIEGSQKIDELIAERDRLAELNRELVEALMDAKGGMALAYHCASKKFNDEVLLHLGVHEARIDKALAKVKP